MLSTALTSDDLDTPRAPSNSSILVFITLSVYLFAVATA